jgi:hypothetical protein
MKIPCDEPFGRELRVERLSRAEGFEDIEAWQLARELTRKVYDLTKKSKFASDFGLKGQIQDVYHHAGRPFTLLGDSDRARRHSRFH